MTEWFAEFVDRMCEPLAEAQLDISRIPYSDEDLKRLRALSAFDKAGAHSTMASRGSLRPIPYLVSAALHDKSTDARCSALHALRVLGDSRLVPVFLECLGHPSSSDKWYAMAAISQHAGPEAWEVVFKRTRQILSKDRRTEQGPRSELIEALDYLFRFRDQSESIQLLLGQITTKYAHRLSAIERDWLSSRNDSAVGAG